MKSKFYFFLPLMAVAFPMAAQQSEDTDDEGIIAEGSVLELVRTTPKVKAIIKRARSAEPSTVPTPSFAIKTKDDRFVMSIGGEINPILGYDIGNNLYDQDGAGISFVTGDIPVPATPHHRGDFYINPINAYVDFSVVGFAGTANEITGYVKFGTNGVTPSLALSRAYITWRGFTMGEALTLAQDPYASQPPTIDPEGPCGDISTVAYQISYKSKSYNGFRFALGMEMPSFYSSNGYYRGKDYAEYFDKLVDASVDAYVPDFPMWIEYQASTSNRIRATAILRDFAYRDLVHDTRRNLLGWGASLSGNFSFWKPLTFNFLAAYGQGIGNYLQDIAGRPLSFTPVADKPGYMQANKMMGLVFGASYNATSKLQFNAVGSMSRIWGVGDYATLTDNANYRYAVYVAANCFYNITSYLQWGIEYLYGRHETWNIGGANDSRIQTQIAFTF